VPLTEAGPVEPWWGEEVVCRQRLGGLLKSYRKPADRAGRDWPNDPAANAVRAGRREAFS
jgi:hypothetical protein